MKRFELEDKLLELHDYLFNNRLNRYNLYICYAAVFDLNYCFQKLGWEDLMFPETVHLTECFNQDEKLGDGFFENIISQLSDPYYDEIERAWFAHCEKLKGLNNE